MLQRVLGFASILFLSPIQAEKPFRHGFSVNASTSDLLAIRYDYLIHLNSKCCKAVKAIVPTLSVGALGSKYGLGYAWGNVYVHGYSMQQVSVFAYSKYLIGLGFDLERRYYGLEYKLTPLFFPISLGAYGNEEGEGMFTLSIGMGF